MSAASTGLVFRVNDSKSADSVDFTPIRLIAMLRDRARVDSPQILIRCLIIEQAPVRSRRVSVSSRRRVALTSGQSTWLFSKTLG